MKKTFRQKPHYRVSKRGRKFVAGRGKKKVKVRKMQPACSATEQRQVIKQNYESIANTLKQTGRVRIPDIGIISVKTKKATPARVMDNPFKPGEKLNVKAKPKRRIVKFRAAKNLVKKIN